MSFLFQTTQILSRPLLGAITWTNLTAANAWLAVDAPPVDAAPVGAAVLESDQASDCGALSARIVALRRAGKEVVLVPSPPWYANQK